MLLLLFPSGQIRRLSHEKNSKFLDALSEGYIVNSSPPPILSILFQRSNDEPLEEFSLHLFPFHFVEKKGGEFDF